MCGTKRLNPFFQITRGQYGRLLNKYAMGVWRDNFTVDFFDSFIVTVLIYRHYRTSRGQMA